MRKLKILKLTIFITAVLGMGVFLSSGQVQAASTYYVAPAPNGADSNNGSISSPWATFNYAISHPQVPAGSTIIAKAGTYNQTIAIDKSITLQGTLDANGNRLSIIDPYTDVSGGWTYDNDGVWKKNFAYPVYAMNVDPLANGIRYNILRLCKEDDDYPMPNANAAEWCKYWNSYLRYKDELHKYTSLVDGDYWVNTFDVFETYFTCLNTSPYACYVRFRDQATNMNTKKLYAAKNANASIIVLAPDVTIKDFDIKAIANGVSIGRWGYPDNADNTTVENCEISLGKVKVWVSGGGTNAIIKNNILHDFDYARSYIANPLFARGASSTHPDDLDSLKVKAVQYVVEKHRMAPDGDSYVNTGVLSQAINTNIDGNTIYNVHNATDLSKSGSIIQNNKIYNITSVGAVFERNNGVITIRDNTMIDPGNAAIRFMWWGGDNESPNDNGVNNTTAYIYRNKIWLPNDGVYGRGSGIIFHYDNPCSPNCGTKTPGKAWIYHNSFSGSQRIIGVNNMYAAPETGMTDVHFINNILSAAFILQDQPMAECKYNWAAGKTYMGNCAFGTNNINNGETMMWPNPVPHDFQIPATGNGSDAINSALNLYTAGYNLPGANTANYWGSDSAPDMGAIESGDIPTNPADVNGDGRVNIKDIQEVIRCIINTSCGVSGADVNKDTRINIKDIQEIIRKIIGN